jgi:hypothetical protein
MTARKKANSKKSGAARPRLTATKRAKPPTKAQLAARERFIAESGVVITDEMLAEIDRELRSL